MVGISILLGLVTSQVRKGLHQARIVAELRQFEIASDYDISLWTERGERLSEVQESLAIAVHYCGLQNYFYSVYSVRSFGDYSPEDSQRVLALIRQLPAVRMLRVSGIEIHAADLVKLPQLESLAYLDKYHYDGYRSGILSDDDLIPLCRAKQLRSLELGNQPIGDAALSHLVECRNLERLEVPKTKVGDEGLRHLSGLTTTKSLELYGTNVTDAGLKHLAAMNLLESLSIGGTKINGSGFGDMGSKPELQALNAYHSELNDDGLSKLSAFPRLRTVHLDETRVRGPGLAHLCRLEFLVYLYLNDCPINDEGVKSLPAFPLSCTEIHLARTQLTDTGIISLQLSPDLGSLDLQGTSVTDATMEHLTKFKQLWSVNVIGTQVTPQGIERLKGAINRCYIKTDIPW